MGKNPNSQREIRQSAAPFCALALKNQDKFRLAHSLHWRWRGPIVGRDMKKGNAMFVLSSARDTATAFAAAFITAMLFVSTATSALPIA